MSVIKVRNEDGEFVDIPVIKGDKGEKGDPGNKGDKGDPGSAGASATINGVNALNISVSGGLSDSQSGSTYTINGNALKPVCQTITLSASNWSNSQQTVSVQGVSANTAGQVIEWGAHDENSYLALAQAQLFAKPSTSANRLVFKALGTVPTENVTLDIKIQGAQS